MTVAETFLVTAAPPATDFVRVIAHNEFGSSGASREIVPQVDGDHAIVGWLDPKSCVSQNVIPRASSTDVGTAT